MTRLRRVFLVVAGGNIAAERHFEDTIQRKRTVEEVKNFLPPEEVGKLESIYHNQPFIVWGAVPGPSNIRFWERMEPGDIVLIYNQGAIRFVGEISAKVRSKDLARNFWRETPAGETWELMYFIVNEEKVDVPIDKLNPLLGYKDNFRPQGFLMINEKAVQNFASSFGDITGVLRELEVGKEPAYIPVKAVVPVEEISERIERSQTEHDEMQWRLIRLGSIARLDIWVPRSDQGKEWEGNQFRNLVLPEFQSTIDVPPQIENIDVVWKFGYAIKSAFEIEHSTSIYSGILRLSDLRAMAPNSTYPLFIVAAADRRAKVFEELKRPTFSGPCLRLNEVIKFLDYEKVREIDSSYKNESSGFDSKVLTDAGEGVQVS